MSGEAAATAESGESAALGAPRGADSHLLVRAGETVCALPLAAVRRVVLALPVHPLPGAGAALRGLAEYGGEPLPVLDLAALVAAPPAGTPAFPVTVVVWAGAGERRELVGLAADAALEVTRGLPEGARALDLAALTQPPEPAHGL